MGIEMIVVTRLGGGEFGVNPDLIQRLDSAPDTILTLIDGTKYIVEESMTEVIDLVQDHRATLLARAQAMHSTFGDTRDAGDADDTDDRPVAQPVPLRPRRR
jgi:flagellar protein FlbD